MEDFLAAAFENSIGIGGAQPGNDPVNDGTKKFGFVFIAMIESALRHARELGNGLDTRRAISLREEKARGDIEDLIPDLRRLLLRGPSSAAQIFLFRNYGYQRTPALVARIGSIHG